ncbi:MAG: carbohydrate kinase family protein [Candidatus Thorarchaeota archaeon]
MEIVVVGHLSRDLIVTPDYTREALGGGTAYAMIAPHLGALGAGIVTRVGSDFEQEYINVLKESNLDLSGFRTAGNHSTRFVNEYDAHGKRTQRVDAIAPEIRASDLLLAHLQANIIHFSPLMHEVHFSCIESARQYGALVSLDVQGYTRTVDNGKVIPRLWTDAMQVLRYVDVVKCDKAELELTTGTGTEMALVTKIQSVGPRIVIVTKDQAGSTIYTRNSRIDVPMVIADAMVDTTGSGDTYIIGFLLEYMRTGDVRRAGLFGATCASYNLEHVGPYNLPTRALVEKRMSSYI